MGSSTLIILVLSASLVLGCSKNSQDPDAGQNISLSIGDTSCLDGAGTKLQNFFAGTGTADDIHGVWTCAAQLLTDFTQYTEGASPDGYTASELQGFLAKYYFQNTLSAAVISTTLKLKAGLVGGTNDFVTRGEIQLLIQAVGILDSATQQMFPYTKILFTDAQLTASEADWSSAYQAFGAGLNQVSAFIAQSGQTYAFGDLSALLAAWTTQLNLPSGSFVVKIAGYVPVLGPAKAILVAGSATGVNADEWPPLVSALASGYSYYRMYMRLTPTGDYTVLLSSGKLPWLVGGAVNLIDVAVQRRPSQQIALSEIQNLLTLMQSQSFFPTTITAAQLTSAVQFVLDKVFPAPPTPVDTLSAGTVGRMQTLMNNWNSDDAALVAKDWASAPDFAAAVDPAGVFLGQDAQGRVVFPLSGSGVYHEYSVIFAVVEWIGAQWGTWPLSQTAFNTAVSDWLTVLHSFNYLASTSATVSTSLMQEANLFMMSSNGDLLLDKFEAVQYAIYVLSSYRTAQLLESGSASCNGTVTCITTYWFNNRATLLANTPNLLNWLNANPAQWSAFSTDLSNTAGSGEWLMEYMELNYIETYMARFDSNHDQTINLNESLVAFPIFQPTLDILLPANGLTTADDEPMYTYLFKYGTPPSGLGGDFQYLNWKDAQSTWGYNADRSILAGILNSLGSL